MIIYIIIGLVGVGAAVYFGLHHPRKLVRTTLHVYVDNTRYAQFVCYAKKCDNCILKFTCGTERTPVSISIDRWQEIENKVKKFVRPVKD